MQRLGIVPHPTRPLARDLTKRVLAWAELHHVTVVVPEPEAATLGVDVTTVKSAAFAAGLDCAVSLGGDGTMLRTVDLVSRAGVPVLGVNAGQLGYLTEVEPDALESALDAVANGAYTCVERMTLRVAVRSDGPAAGEWCALNEAVLEKSQPGRMVRVDVAIDDVPFTTYAADGVIVATPTGSTAYAFSAGGPIVDPALACLLLTPVSPHMLFNRSLVLPAAQTLELSVGDERAPSLILDGRVLGQLGAGDSVRCSAASQPARLVTFGPRDFHQILKAKFGLADR
ncbi:MAG: NAD(+)/NADH kinase [Acidimicrobiia bacterium]